MAKKNRSLEVIISLVCWVAPAYTSRSRVLKAEQDNWQKSCKMETAINYILLLLTIDINIPFEKKVFEYSRYVGFAVMESTVGTHRSTELMFCFQQLFVNLNQKGFWVLVSL